MSTITIENAAKSFGPQSLFTGVSFSIADGEVVALLGRNGCGKSTLIRCIVGLDELDEGMVYTSRNCRIGYLSQQLDHIVDSDAYEETIRGLGRVLALEAEKEQLEATMSASEASSDRPSLASLLKRYERVTREFEAADGYNLAFKVRSTLIGLGLPKECLHAAIETLSGGERMRVALARIILSEPDVLILDEPTNHLDMSATEWLEGFLKGFRGATLVVSHDRYFLDQVADRVLDMDGGRVISYTGNYSSYARKKLGRADEQRRALRKQRQEIKRTEALVQQLRSMGKIRMAKSREKLMQGREMVAPPTDRDGGPRFTFANAQHVSSLIARSSHMSKRFGDRVLLEDVNFTIRGGEKVGIVGPNGSGKSTLLRILLGEIAVDLGEAAIGSWVKYARFSQDICDLDEDRTVLENIMSATSLQSGEAKQYLAKFLFRGEDVLKPVSVLSGGEKARLSLCKMILEEPYCLVLDEPTNHLDIESRECLEDALRDFRGTVIAVSHDRYFLNKVVNRILEIRDRRIYCYEGNYSVYKKQVSLDTDQSNSAANASGHGRDLPTSAVAQGGRRRVERVGRVGQMGQVGSARQTGQVERDLGELEAEIIALEEQSESLERLFADSGFYSRPDCYVKLKEHEEITDRLRVLYDAWDRLS